ncbi:MULTISPECIES: HK97 gp10 family phage protein [Lactiplantibacillus]|uniref:HK97 gp10 family phage protein n=1 Tax=Lactiplantibacillus argentoratensis TaxID=271881 RepID=A0ABS5UH45_9LACO|nr:MULTISPECIES: HK97 gp10 family phage protein [Lactiplantibacillus]MBT1137705.1 HK97 gp10 family phage protein [Lactiplantibacillus argentoratensis]MBT1140563.1 HK97 gp10 family phage protein [Lactiplantibacillus argentoratensis]
MSWGTIDTSQFDEFARQFDSQVSSGKLKTALRQSMVRVGSQTLRGLKNRTPVDTGTLRRGWELQGPTINVSEIVLTAVNNVEYASYIENGHRTRGGSGWIEGVFMMKNTLVEIDRQLPSLLTPEFTGFLQGLM